MWGQWVELGTGQDLPMRSASEIPPTGPGGDRPNLEAAHPRGRPDGCPRSKRTLASTNLKGKIPHPRSFGDVLPPSPHSACRMLLLMHGAGWHTRRWVTGQRAGEGRGRKDLGGCRHPEPRQKSPAPS